MVVVIRLIYSSLKSQLAIYITVASLLMALILQSRSFLIGYVIAIILLIQSSRKQKLRWMHLSIIAFGIIGMIAFLALMVKQNSSVGRMLIYKVSFEMLPGHWISGIGLGKFRTEYLYYQAAYFKVGNFSLKEQLVAGNTYFAFNDYYQLFIETGIIGILLVVVAMSFLIRACYKQLMKAKPSGLVLIAAGQIIAILVAAWFNHILDRFFFQVLLLLCIGIILCAEFHVLRSIRKKVLFFSTVTSLCILITVKQYFFQIVHYAAYNSFKKARLLADAGYHNEAILEMDHIYAELQEYAPFMDFYGNILFGYDATKARSMITKALRLSVSYNSVLKLAQCNSELKQNNQAIENFEMAINMVPCRFEGRFELFNYYLESGQVAEAVKTGSIILALPVKVPSAHLSAIRIKVARCLKSSNQ
jgi:hypothetical protein